MAARLPALLFACTLAAGCGWRHRPEPSPVDPGEPARMNRAFLGAEGPAHLVIQVDWIAGCRPRDGALEALKAWLTREEARPPEEVEIRLGGEVSRGAGSGTEALLSTVAGNARSPEGAYYVYVLYWDRLEKYRGVTFREGELAPGVTFPVVVMLVKPIERDSVLWLTRRKVESAVLVHEFGHVAGLVSSGRRTAAGHCPNPRCRMYWGVDWASLRANAFPVICLGRLPIFFCGECERELALGRRAP